jgi:hypothetical protein
MAWTDGLVIRIEEEVPAFAIHLVTRPVRAQHERLEKPGGMRQVPLRRTRIRHRLQPVVIHLERGAQLLGRAAHARQPSCERGGVRGLRTMGRGRAREILEPHDSTRPRMGASASSPTRHNASRNQCRSS